MDRRLFEAALKGNVEDLNKLLEENPLILEDVVTTSSETPLHIASKVGHLDFVKELLKKKPQFAVEMNQDGFMCMDIASAHGHLEIVRELLRIGGSDLCRRKGRDGRTPLHFAAIKGRVEILKEILSTCPDSVRDVTARGETALHLTVKHYQIEAFKILVQHMEQFHMEEIVKWVDHEGNTVLHHAASRKQLEILTSVISCGTYQKLRAWRTLELESLSFIQSLKILLGGDTVSRVVEVNATNPRGLTALDILDIYIQSPHDLELREILRRAGAMSGQDINTTPHEPPPSHQQDATNNLTSQELPSETSQDWFKYFGLQKHRDSPSDARSALLVVAGLIATVTFQAGINPPGGVWQDDSQLNGKVHHAGKAILGTKPTALTIFLFMNTVGLSAAFTIINFLTANFPFQRVLQLALVSMIWTYSYAIQSIIPVHTAWSLSVITIAFLTPALVWGLPIYSSKFKQRHRRSSTEDEVHVQLPSV